MTPVPPERLVVRATRRWIEDVVLGLGLCPFARRELDAGRVRFVVSRARGGRRLLADLDAELRRLAAGRGAATTTLLIHPRALTRFDDYNRFLDRADAALAAAGLQGVLQIASFHPRYRFAGSAPEAAANYSNRSPYPMLQLLREADVGAAVDAYPDTAAIPARNVARLNALGTERMRALLRGCRGQTADR